MPHWLAIKIDTIFGIVIFFFFLANLQILYWKLFKTYRSYGSMLLLTLYNLIFHVNLYMHGRRHSQIYALERVH